MKDMLYALSKKKPEVSRALCIVGLTLMGSKLTMMTMDTPCGSVARVKRFTPLFFPNNTIEFTAEITRLLALTYTARLLMETTLKTYSSSSSSSLTKNTSDSNSNNTYSNRNAKYIISKLHFQYHCLLFASSSRSKGEGTVFNSKRPPCLLGPSFHSPSLSSSASSTSATSSSTTSTSSKRLKK
ncbi:unnamed protein product [Absidia cylindrospora]